MFLLRCNFYFGLIGIVGLMLASFSTVHADNINSSDFKNEPIQPIIAPSMLDPQKVRLGEKLFHDPRLSKDDTLACSSCHNVKENGALNTAHPIPGVSGKTVPINVPTVWGSSLNFAQFWNGRASTLEDQISGPLQNPDEMGTTWPEIIAKLKMIPEYRQEFMDIYKSPPTEKNIKDAIATFERSLVPANSAFDRYLQGDKKAISATAIAGYGLFKDLGCSSCHQGANVGGNMFQKFGIMGDYFTARGHIIAEDYGRFNITKKEEDRYIFKVPSLRNVEKTAPYFHDGSAATLEDAVNVMAKYQLGRTLSKDERIKLIEFLKTLTGTLPAPTHAD